MLCHGLSSNGNAYQRVLPTEVSPQTVQVESLNYQNLIPGTTINYSFAVTNIASPASFKFSASDSKGYVTSVTPIEAFLNTDESIEVTVELQVPAEATEGSIDILTFLVEEDPLILRHLIQ